MSGAKAIQRLNTGYAQKSGVPVISPEYGTSIRVYSIRLLNQSGSAAGLGVMVSTANASRNYFTYDGSAIVDQTEALDDQESVNVFDTDGTGFLLQDETMFQAVLFTIDSGSTGGTFDVNYWNGSSFSPALQIVDAPTNFSTGQQFVIFSPGPDWVKGGPAGTDQNKFSILFSATGQSGPTTATAINPCDMIVYQPNVPADSAFESSFDSSYPLTCGGEERIYPYFGVASPNNKVFSFFSQGR